MKGVKRNSETKGKILGRQGRNPLRSIGSLLGIYR